MVAVYEEQHSSSKNYMGEGFKVGLINGAIALILMFGSYFISFQTFANQEFYAGFIPYMMLILLFFGLRLRKQNGNYLAFKEALQFCMTAYLVSILMIAIGTFILYNLVDKNLTDKMFQFGLDRTRKMLERLGAPQDQIDDTIDKATKAKSGTTFKNIFLGIGQSLIWAFLKSMIIAIIIRREKPKPAF